MSVYNKRTTRASGRANMTGSIDDVIKAAETTALLERRAFREQKYQNYQIQAFHPFMRLPIEMRAHIYFFAMEEDDASPRDLTTLRSPALALVSKQISQEAVSVFLSRCTFYLDVPSNYGDIATLDRKAANGTLRPLLPSFPGSLSVERRALLSGCCKDLSRQTKSMLRKMQGAGDEGKIRFPNIELRITPAEYCDFRDYNRRLPGPFPVLSLHARAGRLRAEFKIPADCEFRDNIECLGTSAVAVARDIASRHGKHAGFRFEELRETAESFRYWLASTAPVYKAPIFEDSDSDYY